MKRFVRLSTLALLLVLFCSFTDYVNVGKDRQIMRFEAGNQEYCEFLNNLGAPRVDSLHLYSPLMGQHFMGGIQRIEENGRTFFRVKPGYENKPVAAATWQSAIRFINWLHYNALAIRAGKPLSEFVPLTEGDATHGAYDTRTWRRNPGALYWLPTKQEWLQALYPTGKTGFTDPGANVYSPQKGWHEPYPHIRDSKPVGTPSHTGTYDQQGNLAEWVEDRNGDMRLALGGSLIRPAYFAAYGQQEGDFPDKSIPSFGFRVCRNPQAIAALRQAPAPFTSKAPASGVKDLKIKKDKNGGTYVLVDQPGNPGDPQNGYKGAVGYDFYIARSELSNAEYCRFLNAAAAQSDPFRLYNPNMGTGIGGGIVRQSLPGGKFVYKLKSDRAGRMPVVYVGFYELARYCNWLHYGCPKGKEGPGVTEGDNRTGAYDTRDFEAVRSGQKKPYADFGRRNHGARFWIPDGDEWYKAAYYDPRKIGARPYHDYPTGDDAPPQTLANYMRDSRLAIGDPWFYAPVDSFANAPGPFGTLQQGGNVWEWTESWQYGTVGTRALRGGSWQYTEYGLNAVNEDPGGIDDNSYLFGGRIAMAASPSGWQPVSAPLATRIYNKVMTMGQKRLLAILGAVCIMLALLLFLCVIFYRKAHVRKDR